MNSEYIYKTENFEGPLDILLSLIEKRKLLISQISLSIITEDFIEFIKETPNLKPYRTEWTIYHEDIKLAGSIDMIYENPDGTLSIYDWKRSKEIKKINNWNKYALTKSICQMPDANFWHYALQLNTYKAILEAKYDKKVTDLYLV